PARRRRARHAAAPGSARLRALDAPAGPARGDARRPHPRLSAMVTLTQELDAIFQERLGLSLDANALTRAEAWVRTQADTELSLRCWLDSLRAWDAASPAVRGAISVVTNG